MLEILLIDYIYSLIDKEEYKTDYILHLIKKNHAQEIIEIYLNNPYNCFETFYNTYLNYPIIMQSAIQTATINLSCFIEWELLVD